MDGPLFVGAADACDEVILERADGFFGCVAAVDVWWHQLVLHVLLGHESFQSCRCFIVELLELRFEV